MATRSSGSSPHTRGLPHQQPGGCRQGRIIPAHAGFTYLTDAERQALEGSSPHTRGLLLVRAGAGQRPGIIPAHAGFTLRWRSRLCPWSDHPRTRGVYVPAGTTAAEHDGSSPHTRGLRRCRLHLGRRDRIIPAHAGFTWPPGRPRGRRPDHPRTRGVYIMARQQAADSSGSSPHTRGLHYHGVAPMTKGRIIPAHAGFTEAS